MKVLIIGANGNIGTILAKKLKKSNHQPVAMLRKTSQQPTFHNKGIKTVIADLEENFEHAYQGIDAVVFTAGSGGNTSDEKTHLIDRQGAKKAIDLAIKNKVNRFVMVSSMGSGKTQDQWPKELVPYLQAKTDADEHLLQSGLNYTILMPGTLTNNLGTNNITIDTQLNGATIPRTDVATVIEKVLDHPNAYEKSFEFVGGTTPVDTAIESLS
ncbi:SDR family oxidoreductase [Wenyingzhuangia sp. 2_MG-2023]|uniref:SDR family oxidoreductase n=1 Tax=Wenyingzhuangia sp. 2_MG-2023 TaxID=3062639 RepID=UPI0026E402A3|nr:SDR family oxidoreductase [Wenyingzhuangia sp. 2_MG-2023]MDO6738979.1 SDR family oxidoreductase [Wenyingzhuangia sp. 2_MG-2023]